MAKLSFHQGTSRSDQVVILDGEDISKQVRSISITADAGQLPAVVLELMVIEVDSDVPGSVPEIRVAQGTADLLQRFGWTPPSSCFVAAKAYTAEELIAEQQANGQEGQE